MAAGARPGRRARRQTTMAAFEGKTLLITDACRGTDKYRLDPSADLTSNVFDRDPIPRPPDVTFAAHNR
jgi:hypothetical protein